MMNEIKTILKKFDEKFPISIDYPPITEMEVFTQMEIDRRHKRALARHEYIKSFISSHLKALLESLVSELEGEKKMGGEFGFCEHCKLHKGDYEHDYGTCNAYDSALNLAQENIRAKLKEQN